jgi:hypothetical protein
VFLHGRPATRLLSKATFIDDNKNKKFKTTSDVRKRLEGENGSYSQR